MANSKSVTGEAVFQVEAHSFMISASGQGYTLKYSADGEVFDAWDEAIEAGNQCAVINCPRSVFWMCEGNEDVLTIAY